MANKKIIPVVDALKELYGKLGGTPEAVEDISTTAEMLKGIYEAMGGTPEDVEDLSTTTELIQAIADVATPGGGSSDFSTVTVVFTDNGTGSVAWGAANINDGALTVNFPVDGGETVSAVLVCYKNQTIYLPVNPVAISVTPVVTGDISVESSPFGTALAISGDGTVTYSSNN